MRKAVDVLQAVQQTRDKLPQVPMACEREAWMGVCSFSVNGEWIMPIGRMTNSIALFLLLLMDECQQLHSLDFPERRSLSNGTQHGRLIHHPGP